MHAMKTGFVALSDHPAWQAALRAPVVAETAEEREAVAEALNSGPVIASAQVSAELARRPER